MRSKILGAAVLLFGLAHSSFGEAPPSFSISGTIYVTSAQATPVVTPAGTCPAGLACIFWQDSSGANNGKVDISTTGLPNFLLPLAMAGNDAANIAPLQNPPDLVGSPISVPSFMTFNNGGVTLVLNLNRTFPGAYPITSCSAPPAVGQVCTPAGSMFNFVNNPPASGQATATWVFEGTSNGGLGSWTGVFAFGANTPFQSVLNQLATKGYIVSTFSATITFVGIA